jgi:hypothetical protein
MNESIQDDRQEDIRVVVNMRVEPVEQENCRVVVDMQEGQLAPFLVQDDENRVPKIPNLGNVKQPKQFRNWRILRVVHVAGHERVVVSVGQKSRFDGHVRAQHDLRNVVNELDGIWINRRHTSLHDQTAEKDKYQVRQRNVKGGGKVGKRPSLAVEEQEGYGETRSWGNAAPIASPSADRLYRLTSV